MKENNKIWLRYIICFGLIAILCYLFPYTGDDWAWEVNRYRQIKQLV